jgi:hypothetical protein
VERCLACEADRGDTGRLSRGHRGADWVNLEIRCHGLGLASEAPSTGGDGLGLASEVPSTGGDGLGLVPRPREGSPPWFP